MSYKMLMWSTDENERVVVLINGKRYTHAETVALHRELTELLEAKAAETIEPGAMVEHIRRLRASGQGLAA